MPGCTHRIEGWNQPTPFLSKCSLALRRMTSLAIRAIPDGKQTTHESLQPLEGCFVLENSSFLASYLDFSCIPRWYVQLLAEGKLRFK